MVEIFTTAIATSTAALVRRHQGRDVGRRATTVAPAYAGCLQRAASVSNASIKRQADQVDGSLGSALGPAAPRASRVIFCNGSVSPAAHQAPCVAADDPEPPLRPLARLPSSNHATGDAQDWTMIEDDFRAEMWRPACAERYLAHGGDGRAIQSTDAKPQHPPQICGAVAGAFLQSCRRRLLPLLPPIQPPLNTSSSLLSHVA
jgi:hypothetical protein